MANKILIGDNALSPIVTIQDDKILSISKEAAVSLVGEEMYIDTFTPILNYDSTDDSGHIIFQPTDYTGILTNDSPKAIFCALSNINLRGLPFGTVIWYYRDDNLIGQYYLNNVERIGREKYRLNCMSAIGLLDNQIHVGGIYTGQTFETVLDEIIDDSISGYTVSDEVANLEIYGWLPYSTKRKNLYQLTFATGVSILRNESGSMHFTFLDGGATTRSIPPENVFDGGTVTYDTHASKIEVVEHGYYYYGGASLEVMFDNTNGEALYNDIVLFDKPIVPIGVSGTGNIYVSYVGVNYCIASGTGTISALPYVHVSRVVSKTNPSAKDDKVIRVEDATLVTVSNSENVARRLAAYYFNADHFKSDIKVDDSIFCGLSYVVQNAYMEQKQAFITRMSSRVSSFERSTCEFVNGYVPSGSGNTFDYVTDPPIDAASSGTWQVPSSVFEKEVPYIRVVLIGKGSKGSGGENGEDGERSTSPQFSPGGLGGKGGAGGTGGKVLVKTLDCTGISSFSYSTDNDGNVTFSGGSYNLSSANGASSSTGFFEQITGKIYAEPGYSGKDGASGGRGGRNNPLASLTRSTDGDIAEYKGVIYNSGLGADNDYYNAGSGSSSSGLANTEVYIGGGGGGGAAVGGAGYNGYGVIKPTPSQFGKAGYGGDGGNGASGDTVKQVYGSGGNGGHGGGGGGGGGQRVYYNVPSSRVLLVEYVPGGSGGSGGSGSDGYKGCIIIYY